MTARIAVRDRELEWRRLDGEVVILDLRPQRHLSLNKSGATPWSPLAAGTSRQERADELVGRYAISIDAAGRDVELLLGQLADAGLLEGTDGDGAPAEA